MPAGNVRIASIAFGQLRCQRLRIFPVYWGIGTGIVPLSEFMLSAFIIRSCCLRIILHHPGRKRCCGCCEHNIILLTAEHVHNIIQLFKIIGFFRGLKPGPGKYIHRRAVNPRISENPHVFVPNLPWATDSDYNLPRIKFS